VYRSTFIPRLADSSEEHMAGAGNSCHGECSIAAVNLNMLILGGDDNRQIQNDCVDLDSFWECLVGGVTVPNESTAICPKPDILDVVGHFREGPIPDLLFV